MSDPAPDRRDVVLHDRKSMYSGYSKVDVCRFSFPRFDGTTEGPIEREVIDRGHAAAVLPYDPVRDEVVLIRQFRMPVYMAGSAEPWMYEVVAGVIDPGETAEAVAIREAKEEAGLTIGSVERIMRYYVSPGMLTERIDLFLARVDATAAQGIHGLDAEAEDIRVEAMTAEAAFAMLSQGRLENATVVLALQWLALNRDRLRSSG